MRVELLLFGPLSARLGRSAVALEFTDEGVTCGEVRRAFVMEHPEAEALLPSHRFARNQTLVDDDEPVRPGDELALIGMVSGG